jgi:glutamyl-tRNA synthetase
MFLGRTELDPSHRGGDFVVGRRHVGPAYQLAVVVDDALMGISHVIRGDDLVASTPRQILLYRRLGWPEPQFGHVSLVVDANGRRLAKRDSSLKLATLRDSGVGPRRLVGALIQSCGWSDEIVPSAPADWIHRFDSASIPRHPWVITTGWLDWLRAAS